MDIEEKQAEIIDQFVKQAANRTDSALSPLIVEATSHPSLFAFSEILSVPSVVQVSLFQQTDLSFMFIVDCLSYCFVEVKLLPN